MTLFYIGNIFLHSQFPIGYSMIPDALPLSRMSLKDKKKESYEIQERTHSERRDVEKMERKAKDETGRHAWYSQSGRYMEFFALPLSQPIVTLYVTYSSLMPRPGSWHEQIQFAIIT